VTPEKGLGFRAARYVYRGWFERPVWWWLAKVKEFFFAETLHRLTVLESRLGQIEERLQRMEASTPAQWDALEQLILAILRQPAQDCQDLTSPIHLHQSTNKIEPSELNGVNATGNLR